MKIENLRFEHDGWQNCLVNDEYCVTFSDYHDTFCCENHYIDWSYGLEEVNENMRFTIDTDNIENLFEKVEGYGIRLIPNPGTGHPVAFPGYGENNGYYNDDIMLVITIYDKTTKTIVFNEEYNYYECQDYYNG